MKLSTLYTEDSIFEDNNPLKDLIHRSAKIFSRAKQTPDPRQAKIKKTIRAVYQKVWGDYRKNPKALKRIDSYMHSIDQHLPYLMKIENKKDLKQEIEAMIRKRAEQDIDICT